MFKANSGARRGRRMTDNSKPRQSSSRPGGGRKSGASRVIRLTTGVMSVAVLAATGLVGVAAPAFAAGGTITYNVNAGASGAPVVFSGTGWSAYDSVTVKFAGSNTGSVCTITATATGSIGPRSCAVPAGLPAGNYTVTASDTSNLVDGVASFAVEAGITLTGGNGNTTSDAAVGQTVGVFGSDFATTSVLTATFGGNPVSVTGASS